MNSKLRILTLGAGHLGRIHCRLLQELDDVELIGVVDPHTGSREAAADDLSIPTFVDHRECAGRFDAAIVATPTIHHHAVTMELLAAGAHVFVEKPLAPTASEADDMVTAADEAGCVLQVGHSERFNPAFQVALAEFSKPRLIEARRCGPYTFRATDVGVVLDLMIHDIDLVLQLVGNAKLVDLHAVGGRVFGPHEDWSEARLEFENQTVANLSVSRVSSTPQRTMRIHGERSYAELNFADGAARVVRPKDNLQSLDAERLTLAEKRDLQSHLFEDLLPVEDRPATPWNAILEEQRDFVSAIRGKQAPQVEGKHARDAIRIAEQVIRRIEEGQQHPVRKAA